MTLADAIIAHDEALRYGGRDGVSSLHLIESAIARPYSGYHRSISSKAAALLYSVVNNHGFVDGNKRTAWILVEILIERSGYTLAVGEDEPVDDLVVAVASGELRFEALLVWFNGNIVRR